MLRGGVRRVLGRRCYVSDSAPGVRVSPEVREAVEKCRAVIALESTIISHGMPFPENLELARSVESLARAAGAVPATVAVVGGELRVGLGDEELEQLARAGPAAHKCSRRDLARVLSSGELGATTVSGTMIAAASAGISVFATGGIGGVHRGGEVTMDVSADLTELGRTPVAVVCAGVKSILDIARTLEVLETQGVYVGTLVDEESQSPSGAVDFPAFFSPRSGVPSPHVVRGSAAAAQIIWQSVDRLRLQSGLLIACPNPSPLASDLAIEAAVQDALRAAESSGVRGKDVTPFVLSRVNHLTRGASLASNMALVRNNVVRAASIARHLSHLRQGRRSLSTSPAPAEAAAAAVVVVVGASLLDTTCRPRQGTALAMGSSTPGVAEDRAGGVGRNVAWTATCLASSGTAGVHFATTAADDAAGRALLQPFRDAGARLSVRPAARTPRYLALLDDHGALVAAVADTDGVEALSDDAWVDEALCRDLAAASVVVAEANLAASTLEKLALATAQRSASATLWLEPISPAKCVRLISLATLGVAAVVTPNRFELTAMAAAWRVLARQHNLPLPAPPAPDQTLAWTHADRVARTHPRPPHKVDHDHDGVQEDDDDNDDEAENHRDGAASAADRGLAMGGLDVGVLANVALDKSLLDNPRVRERMRELGISQQDVAEFLSAASAPQQPSQNKDDASEADAEATAGAWSEVLTNEVLADAQCVLVAMCNPGAGELDVTLVEGKKHVVAKFGEAGVLWVSAPPAPSVSAWRDMAARPFLDMSLSPEFGVDFRFVRAAPSASVVDVSGAGDTLVATTASLVAAGTPMGEALLWATAAARLAVETKETSPSPAKLRALGQLAAGAALDPETPQADAQDVVNAVRAVCAVNPGAEARAVLARLP